MTKLWKLEITLEDNYESISAPPLTKEEIMVGYRPAHLPAGLRIVSINIEEKND
jgi:hypothetical protein